MATAHRWIGLALSALFLLVAQYAAAQTNLDRVKAAGLPKHDGVVTLYRSQGAAREAALYGPEVEAAAQWYRTQLGWTRRLDLAVLDKDDFPRITEVPYPSPHAESRTGFIIIADHVVDHPGFDRWDIDEVAINCAWSFHEIGHVIAADLGIWSGNAWINELVASVFMAAYVRAQRPQFGGFQSGMPPRFTPTGRFSGLAEFDALYFSIGQWDYLWYHFHIARIADYLAAGGDLRTIADALRREFPATARRRETTAQTFERLERVRAGVTAFAGPFAAP
jgi:hypothetical protein